MSRASAYTTTRVPGARPIGIGHPVGMPYTAPELAAHPLRQGATTLQAAPSRVGDTLRYRDGTVTDLAGNIITQRGAHHVTQGI